MQHQFRKEAPFQNHLGLMVEILALGSGDRIWRFEGIDADEQLAGVRSRFVSVVPDVDDDSVRNLTLAERAELRRLYRAFNHSWERIVSVLFIGLIGNTALAWGYQALFSGQPGSFQTFFFFCAIVAGLAFALNRCVIDRIRFARTLRSDLKAGVVCGGSLASGTPWVVNGLPAPWRLGAWGETSTVLKLVAWLRKRMGKAS